MGEAALIRNPHKSSPSGHGRRSAACEIPSGLWESILDRIRAEPSLSGSSHVRSGVALGGECTTESSRRRATSTWTYGITHPKAYRIHILPIGGDESDVWLWFSASVLWGLARQDIRLAAEFRAPGGPRLAVIFRGLSCACGPSMVPRYVGEQPACRALILWPLRKLFGGHFGYH